MSYTDEKFARIISGKYRNCRVKTEVPLKIEFSCVVCGDSETNTHKARGAFLTGKRGMFFKCLNCDYAASFFKYMQEIEPAEFAEYRKERRLERFRPKLRKAEPKPIMAGNKTADQLAARKADPASVLLPLPSGCIDYLESRSVPDYGDFRYVDDMRKLAPFIEGEQRLTQEGRLAMPVRNRAGELVGLSCRSLHPQGIGVRYINVKFRDEEAVYNADGVDASRTVYVTEGILDSKFLDNAIAVLGTDLTKAARVFNKAKLVLIFDNQYDNVHVRRKIEKAIEAGFRVVIWPKSADAHGKDINEMVLAGFDKSELLNTIEANTFRGARATTNLRKRI